MDSVKTKSKLSLGKSQDAAAREIIQFCSQYIKGRLRTDTFNDEFVMTELEPTEEEPSKHQLKLFNDPIHGSILLNPLEDAIINTPEFYRLRDIKQLGGKCYVYPGAVHTRFEHSIGVCHLAGEFVRHLRQTLPDEKDLISDTDEYCIRLAGLCHDLGHGPFSHVFEHVTKEIGLEKAHEEISVLMFQRILLEHPKVLHTFVYMNLKKIHVEKICCMINGSQEMTDMLKAEKEQKAYLYEIVANKDSGLDVDKWDYFTRDCYFLGVKNEFDAKRCMTLSRIIEYEEKKDRHIGFRDKEYVNIYGMFRTRCMIHQKACSHRKVAAIEMMLKDAMVEAKDIELFPCKQSLQTILTSAKDKPADLSGYIYLSDNILSKIWENTSECTNVKAQELVNRIILRDCYERVVQRVLPDDKNPVLSKDVKKKIKNLSHIRCPGQPLYEIHCAPVSYASERKEDPVEDVHFFSKEHDKNKKFPILKEKVTPSMSYVTTPKSFAEYRLRLFRKISSESGKINEEAEEQAKQWFSGEVEKALNP